MTWRDKLEIGLKEDAPYRKDNLPESEIRGPEIPTGPGQSRLRSRWREGTRTTCGPLCLLTMSKAARRVEARFSSCRVAAIA